MNYLNNIMNEKNNKQIRASLKNEDIKFESFLDELKIFLSNMNNET